MKPPIYISSLRSDFYFHIMHRMSWTFCIFQTYEALNYPDIYDLNTITHAMKPPLYKSIVRD